MIRRALAIDEQSYGTEHPTVVNRLSNLAHLLYATNRLSEADPLSWRIVTIYVAFRESTGQEHSLMHTALANYFEMLQAMGLSQEEAIAKIRSKLKGNDE